MAHPKPASPAGQGPLVLLVDDEPDLVHGLSTTLIRAGFRVATARDGGEALAVFQALLPALVVLDLMLPVKDGLEVCRELRRISDVPILMLTARDDSIDKILGLELGADDYVTKPFDSRELVARIRSILRRVNRQYPGSRLILDGGRVQINLAAQTVTVAGQPVALTPTEFALLVHLARHPGQVFSREELLEQVWGYDFPGDLRTVDVHIRRLRQKIEADPASPALIVTRFGIGYVLAKL
ncbi:response regulator transcription factor [Moorella sp. Hama-1]|uniref:response regulator transcription factor n=1 Tax=Moorella sp. Hama-1 TaxID=2138101 RepID=UPI001F321D3F|nr:response regulator transcription factor [Moorella sp. Hama-1]BCV22597.1 DNA-binding response regulator [Moorella sp. Hama-1]